LCKTNFSFRTWPTSRILDRTKPPSKQERSQRGAFVGTGTGNGQGAERRDKRPNGARRKRHMLLRAIPLPRILHATICELSP
ncbi:MAG TPA: hypothetical protein VFX76_23200, partial [Roseiflexaceae bacterium]|nr:hypothetical protein [Roseiflexaceae bacterium]